MMERAEDRPAPVVTLRTQCGRSIAVGRLLIAAEDPIGRVVLRVNRMRVEYDHLWASLTAGEARLLARRLLAEADVVQPPTRRRRRRVAGPSRAGSHGRVEGLR